MLRSFMKSIMRVGAPFPRLALLCSFHAKNGKNGTNNSSAHKYEYICLKCKFKGDTSSFFCEGCHYLKDPTTLKEFNYFELFGIKSGYNINKEELEKRYHALQRTLHPDKYSGKDEKLVNLATEYSTYVNMAYRVLKDDERRAKYLLKLEAGDLFDETAVIEDREFLGKIMRINEEIEECETLSELQQKKKELQKEMNALVKSISEHFKKKQYKEIVIEVTKVRFCKRALEQIDRKECEMIQ